MRNFEQSVSPLSLATAAGDLWNAVHYTAINQNIMTYRSLWVKNIAPPWPTVYPAESRVVCDGPLNVIIAISNSGMPQLVTITHTAIDINHHTLGLRMTAKVMGTRIALLSFTPMNYMSCAANSRLKAYSNPCFF
ncbi:hypothetical protein SAMN00768000_1009 [Sulfobacillus thermosulfidooxidans DSM 9293]|uniref:Uncharacterized protein n=1 Tax=Sulfobacillus thermosulfidooxidans (strain DSM 9293 / VKM B-1269 / AT-1) TaxID=929705 RepID=A0A1W1WAW4_SULTA|nr:hypothetical protein [Sulfobacillus thermosulfidooxidans]SMC03289.1 hypothetical protein SAMN00768000_1009 [Sulfobacillus thermosulfidooxidans DSM 9293]